MLTFQTVVNITESDFQNI